MGILVTSYSTKQLLKCLHDLSTVQKGHITDVIDDPPLYTEKWLDKESILRYKCSKGTTNSILTS